MVTSIADLRRLNEERTKGGGIFSTGTINPKIAGLSKESAAEQNQSSVGRFFNDASGAIGRGVDFVKEKSSELGDYLKTPDGIDTLSGVADFFRRGTLGNVAVADAQAAPFSGNKVLESASAGGLGFDLAEKLAARDLRKQATISRDAQEKFLNDISSDTSRTFEEVARDFAASKKRK